MNYKSFVLQIFATLLLVSQFSLADDYFTTGSTTRSRFGFEYLRFKGGGSDSGTQGSMIGLRSSYYINKSEVSLGYQVNFGSIRDAAVADNNLVYGGLTLGYDKSFAKILFYDLNLLLGYGYGRIASENISTQGFAIQPSIGIGFILVSGYRVSFNPGYFYMPNSRGLSGLNFGIRLERKTDSQQSRGVDK